jgi:hypothetical protein
MLFGSFLTQKTLLILNGSKSLFAATRALFADAVKWLFGRRLAARGRQRERRETIVWTFTFPKLLTTYLSLHLHHPLTTYPHTECCGAEKGGREEVTRDLM